MSKIIAVDIGGTRIRATAFSDGNSTPSRIQKIPTRSNTTSTFDRVCESILSVWPESDQVAAISVASPGPLDPKTGIVFSAPNIPGWENFPLVSNLSSRFDVPVFIGNDANLAALGEWQFGAGKGHGNILYLTISTGIGGGVIVDNRLLLGARGLAAELGHIPILTDGPICSCGQPGHLEAVASGTAISNYVNERLKLGVPSSLKPERKYTAQEIADSARSGDDLSIEAYTRSGRFIGQALAGFLHIFNPSIVIIGGGVSFSGSILFEPIRTALDEYVMDPSYLVGLTITRAELGDDAGLFGALALAKTQLQSG